GVRFVVLGCGRHVVVSGQRPEVPLGVVVHRSLVSQPPIRRIRPVEEFLREGIELDRICLRCNGIHRIAPASLYFSMSSHAMPASIKTSSVCWPCSGAPGGTTGCSSN